MKTEQLTPRLLSLLDGSLHASHRHQAIRLSTVGACGWPYAAQLSYGEVLAVSAQQIRFALWPNATTAANLQQNGKMTLALVDDGAVIEIQALAQRRTETLTDAGLLIFDAAVRQVVYHRAPYATVTSGLTFSLNDEHAALARWQQQIAGLKALP